MYRLRLEPLKAKSTARTAHGKSSAEIETPNLVVDDRTNLICLKLCDGDSIYFR
jgi:hypothetical protein